MTYPKDFEVREIPSRPPVAEGDGPADAACGFMPGALVGTGEQGEQPTATWWFDRNSAEQDVLAYLRRRRANALAIARTNSAGSELHELATDRAQQCQVIIDDVTGGLHHGAAQIEAELAEAEAARLAADAELAGISQACRHGAEGDISTGAPTPPQADGIDPDKNGGKHGVS